MTQKCTLKAGVGQTPCESDAVYRITAAGKTEYLCEADHARMLWSWIFLKDLPKGTEIRTERMDDLERERRNRETEGYMRNHP